MTREYNTQSQPQIYTAVHTHTHIQIRNKAQKRRTALSRPTVTHTYAQHTYNIDENTNRNRLRTTSNERRQTMRRQWRALDRPPPELNHTKRCSGTIRCTGQSLPLQQSGVEQLRQRALTAK